MKITGKHVQFANQEYAYVRLRIAAGSNHETSEQLGAAHMVEHLLTSSTNPSIQNLLSKQARILGITSRDDVEFYIKLPSIFLKDALIYIIELFDNSNFQETQITLEKNRVLKEIKNHTTNPYKYLYRVKYRILFNFERMHHLNTGSEEQVRILTISALHDYKTAWYKPEHAVLTIVSNNTTEYISELMRSLQLKLVGIEKRVYKPPRLEIEATIGDQVQILENSYTSDTHSRCDYIGSVYGTPDHLCEQVLVRLFKSFHPDIQNAESYNSLNFGTLGFTVTTKASSGTQALAYTQQLTETLDGLLTEEKIENAKKQVMYIFSRQIKDPGHFTDLYSEMQLYNADFQTPEEALTSIRLLKNKQIAKHWERVKKHGSKISIISPTS